MDLKKNLEKKFNQKISELKKYSNGSIGIFFKNGQFRFYNENNIGGKLSDDEKRKRAAEKAKKKAECKEKKMIYDPKTKDCRERKKRGKNPKKDLNEKEAKKKRRTKSPLRSQIEAPTLLFRSNAGRSSPRHSCIFHPSWAPPSSSSSSSMRRRSSVDVACS